MHYLIAFISALLFWPITAEAIEYSIMTGSPTGTYFQIGRDIQRLAAPHGIDLQVVPSAGSLENVQAVFARPNTQLAIVQSDVLTYISVHSDDPELKRIAKNIRMVFPLYNEEVHILARKAITSLADLSGKRVVIGERQSGTFLTATLLLQQAGVRPAEELHLSASAGIQALRQGQADAVFYVTGQPAPLFIESVTAADDFHLLPISDPRVLRIYEASRIPGGAYPWQPNEVPVIAVRAILMTYDYGKSTAYLRQSCKAVGQIARIIRDNMADLQRTGAGYHPKWQQVDLNRSVRNWDQARCVQQGLRTAGTARSTGRSGCLEQCAAEANPVARKLCEDQCRR